MRPRESMPQAYYVRREALAQRVRLRVTEANREALARHAQLSRAEWEAEWFEELRQPPGRIRWRIAAIRPDTGETVYLVQSAMHGPVMVPLAQSRARIFGNRTHAEATRRTMIPEFRGLVDWRLERVTVENPTP